MSGSGDTTRPRYGRIAAIAGATSTTRVWLLGTIVPGPTDDPAASVPSAHSAEGGLSLAAASAALATASSTGLRASLSVGLPSAIGGDSSTSDEDPGTTE